MFIEIDRTKWEVPRNRLPPRHHSAEKQTDIHTQVNKLLELGIIQESQASDLSQAHPVSKGDGQWRLTLDFVQLNAATKGLEGLAYSKHTRNINAARYYETHLLRSP